MLDGIYQSVMCFYTTYLLAQPANFITLNGLDLEDRVRMGVFVAHTAVLVVNIYILLNTYRWDWLMLLLSAFSVLLIWFWTGVYGASTYSNMFYGSGAQAYGSLSFWAVLLLTTVICLVPRFTVKAFQKIYMPMDIDIIREQVRQGRFKHLDDLPPEISGTKLEQAATSENSSDSVTKPPPLKPAPAPAPSPRQQPQKQPPLDRDDDTRPIYPPSTAPTTTTYQHGGSANGSDSTADTHLRRSLERVRTGFGTLHEVHSRTASLAGLDPPPGVPGSSLDRPRASFDRARPSFDRIRSSMDLVRPSFELSQDMTTASRLMRVESSHSDTAPSPSDRRSPGPSNLR